MCRRVSLWHPFLLFWVDSRLSSLHHFFKSWVWPDENLFRDFTPFSSLKCPLRHEGRARRMWGRGLVRYSFLHLVWLPSTWGGFRGKGSIRPPLCFSRSLAVTVCLTPSYFQYFLCLRYIITIGLECGFNYIYVAQDFSFFILESHLFLQVWLLSSPSIRNIFCPLFSLFTHWRSWEVLALARQPPGTLTNVPCPSPPSSRLPPWFFFLSLVSPTLFPIIDE